MTIGGATAYTLRALTDIWTGDAGRKPDRTISTGLLGAIRWWFEVLVRGLGGSACDPTKHQCQGDRRCVVCELFGCTGWARKFRFEVLDQSGKTKVEQIKTGDVFQFRFTPLRRIHREEWALLEATLRLIERYGALGGKTKIRKSNNGIKRRPGNGIGRVRVESDLSVLTGVRWEEISSFLRDKPWYQVNQTGFKWAASHKLEALPAEHRRPQALLAHLCSESRGGG